MFIEVNNLIYDSNNPLCELRIANSQGELFAFVTCLDPIEGKKPRKCDQRKYWGRFSWEHQEQSIKGILEYGDKWSKFEN